MRLSYISVALCAALFAIPANAATYLFTLTGSSSASFALSSSPTPDFVIPDIAFYVDGISGSVDGNTETLYLTFSNTNDLGGFTLLGNTSIISTTGAQLYTGTEAAPIFKTGPFELSEFGGDGRYSLNITSVAAAVPEPATWAVMLLGFGITGASLRYRRRATKIKFT